MIIKTLQYDDFLLYRDRIRDLLAEIYDINFDVSHDYSINESNKKLKLLDEYIKSNQAVLIGAIEGENLVGFIWIYRHEYFGEIRMHVNQIIVDRGYKGKGIGKRLLEEAEKKALETGINVIDLFVSEKNIEAMNFYKKSGFITERRYMKKML
ncbi:GNAT family N-acetyltransferase [Acetivibrio straminisolvens]|jgi:ribosomal protein S18 acetylase RimI-like enzyme|uniref:N-acetyltransferase n=1 Tax=Acetivibrio straminisolvens JCM 21531 TaxID=1294263 RepID=W4V800_9FIRM|nr:GNAT family N-acetyltransferase [Acetivibrio straminisolvens]ODM27123.1 acetyltransferase [Clostridium sp. Bc-iso-3]GAE88918.1 N-acetyltransferase [Acetivibrio straminisolvens JCM 21531]